VSCQLKKNGEQNKQIYGSIYRSNSIWSIQYCIDQIEFVNRKKNWKKEMIKNIQKNLKISFVADKGNRFPFMFLGHRFDCTFFSISKKRKVSW